MAQGLIDDIDADHLVPGGDQAERYRSRRSFADPDPINGLDRDEGRAGAGEKSLLSVVQVVGRIIPFDDFDVQLLGQTEDRRLGNTAEDIPIGGRAELAVDDQETIVSTGLAQVTVMSSMSGIARGSACLASKIAMLWFILLVIFAFDSRHCGGIRRVDGMTKGAPST